eukprot:s2951_g14.t1
MDVQTQQTTSDSAWKTVRSFTYQEHLECLAPPLGDCKTVPSSWPQGLGLKVSKLPRVPWLPPGWGQACRSGWKPTIYVSPEEMGSRAFYGQAHVERALGKRLQPVDQHGVVLGDEFIKLWPKWLAKDWRITYRKSANGSVKPFFLGPDDTLYKDKKSVLARTKKIVKQRRTGLSTRKSRPKDEELCNAECFRTFTRKQLEECFAPPLRGSFKPPRHWPKGLLVTNLPRTSWLPKGWTQGYRPYKEKGRRFRKLYVAPPEKGSKVVFHRRDVEKVEGRNLCSVDQHGQPLGIPNTFTIAWPKWLPSRWRLGYFRVGETVKVCFLNAAGQKFPDRRAVLDSLNPARIKQRAKQVKAAEKKKTEIKPIKTGLGLFALRMAQRHRLISSVKAESESDDELPESTDIFLSFTHEELTECFAPPLGDSTTPPAHWPEGVEVCTLPRIPWLPPGWGQGIRMGPQGRKYKVYIPPEGHRRSEVKNKESMEVNVGRRLKPLDQHGKNLRVGGALIEHWPNELPRTWRIGYHKLQGEVRSCFISPNATIYKDMLAVSRHLNMEAWTVRRIEKVNQQEEERLSKCKRLRRMDATMVEPLEDVEEDWLELAVEDAAGAPDFCVQDERMAEETAIEAARPKKRLRTAEGRDILVGIGFEGQTPEDWFTSSNYYALLQPVIEMQRTTQQVMEFLHVLVMVHGERCLYPDLRNNLGYAVTWAAKLSEEVHKIQLSAVYHSRMSLFETSTDVLRHLLPTIDVLTAAAQFADAFAEVRLTLDKLASTQPGSLQLVLPEASPSPYQDGGGAFMDMTFIVRNLTNGWHLDHALLASLVRLWPPPASHGDGCHTTVADFGAGGGHYCKFFNKTGDYCCSAFDGSPKAALYTGGAVQTQRLDEYFDLGRRFDWLLCLEVLEHIPEAKEANQPNQQKADSFSS